jgi:hypothetical protein
MKSFLLQFSYCPFENVENKVMYFIYMKVNNKELN